MGKTTQGPKNTVKFTPGFGAGRDCKTDLGCLLDKKPSRERKRAVVWYSTGSTRRRVRIVQFDDRLSANKEFGPEVLDRDNYPLITRSVIRARVSVGADIFKQSRHEYDRRKITSSA